MVVNQCYHCHGNQSATQNHGVCLKALFPSSPLPKPLLSHVLLAQPSQNAPYVRSSIVSVQKTKHGNTDMQGKITATFVTNNNINRLQSVTDYNNTIYTDWQSIYAGFSTIFGIYINYYCMENLSMSIKKYLYTPLDNT